MKQKILFVLFGILTFNIAFGQNNKTPEVNLNRELIAILDTIYSEDQKYRKESQVLEKKYGWNSTAKSDGIVPSLDTNGEIILASKPA